MDCAKTGEEFACEPVLKKQFHNRYESLACIKFGIFPSPYASQHILSVFNQLSAIDS